MGSVGKGSSYSKYPTTVWHSTNPDNVSGILSDGLNSGNGEHSGGYFGNGIYLSSDATTRDLYAIITNKEGDNSSNPILEITLSSNLKIPKLDFSNITANTDSEYHTKYAEVINKFAQSALTKDAYSDYLKDIPNYSSYVGGPDAEMKAISKALSTMGIDGIQIVDANNKGTVGRAGGNQIILFNNKGIKNIKQIKDKDKLVWKDGSPKVNW